MRDEGWRAFSRVCAISSALIVPPGVKVPPSLRNIFKEWVACTGESMPANGSLIHWARRGVLLLNAVLTVEDGQPEQAPCIDR